MSDDKDDLNGFDGLGKTNDDGMHFSEERFSTIRVILGFYCSFLSNGYFVEDCRYDCQG